MASVGVSKHPTTDLISLEVDGSLANPYTADAVAIWTVTLSATSTIFARSNSTPGGSLAKPTLFGVLVLATRPMQILIGNMLYWITDQGITSVCFWGGPPSWIAPPVSCSVGLLAWVHVRLLCDGREDLS